MSSDYPNFLSLRRTALTDDVVQGCVSGACQPDGLLSSRAGVGAGVGAEANSDTACLFSCLCIMITG